MTHARRVFLLLLFVLLTAPAVQAQDWDLTGSFSTAPDGRYGHTATRLPDGRVLVVGGTSEGATVGTVEIYDPFAGTWAAGPALSTARKSHAAVQLTNGKVLVVGGVDAADAALASAELYDPNTNTWAAAASMSQTRHDLTLVLLNSGGVLAAGGRATATAEVYNSNTNTWSFVGNMVGVRTHAAAVLLENGDVLVAGGYDGNGDPVATAERLDDATYLWAATGAMATARARHTLTLLPDGDVLAAGGITAGGQSTASAEVYDTGTVTWGATQNDLPAAVSDHAAHLMTDGDVLVAGGGDGLAGTTGTAVYDPDQNTFAAANAMNNARIRHTLTLLPDGKLLAAGGPGDGTGDPQTEFYNASVFDPPGMPPVALDDPNTPVLLRATVSDVFSGPACGPYALTRTFGNDAVDFFANEEVYTDGSSASAAVEENVAVLDGVAGVTLEITGFQLALFEHLPGEIGDRRIYAGGTAVVKENGVTRLQGIGGRFAIVGYYPAPNGPGDLQIATGLIEIDEANSDAAWVAAFNTEGTGVVRLDFVSFDDVTRVCPVDPVNGFNCEDCYDRFDGTVALRPASVEALMADGAFPGGAVTDFTFGEVGVSLDFSSIDASNLGRSSSARLFAEQIKTAPGGSPPSGVARIIDGRYWRLGTTVGGFSTDVGFDFSAVANVGNTSDLVLLKRDDADDAWETVAATVNGTTIEATGVTSFSEWALGSTSASLPVELAAFTAAADGDAVVLRWTTASERDNAGFEVQHRAPGEAWRAAAWVGGHGTTTSSRHYTQRVDLATPGAHRFRLRQVDHDGGATLSPEVEVFRGTPEALWLGAPHPNPAASSVTVAFSSARTAPARVVVTDALGRVVAVAFDGVAAADRSHEVRIDTRPLASGLYLVRLETAAGVRAQRVTVVR